MRSPRVGLGDAGIRTFGPLHASGFGVESLSDLIHARKTALSAHIGMGSPRRAVFLLASSLKPFKKYDKDKPGTQQS